MQPLKYLNKGPTFRPPHHTSMFGLQNTQSHDGPPQPWAHIQKLFLQLHRQYSLHQMGPDMHCACVSPHAAIQSQSTTCAVTPCVASACPGPSSLYWTEVRGSAASAVNPGSVISFHPLPIRNSYWPNSPPAQRARQAWSVERRSGEPSGTSKSPLVSRRPTINSPPGYGSLCA
jgi:hypothetical protein